MSSELTPRALSERIYRLKDNLRCLARTVSELEPGGGGTETDPIFTGSPAFGITSPNISNWNTAFGWGNHASAGYATSTALNDYVPIAGATTVTGNKTFTGTTTLGTTSIAGNFTPSVDNNYTLGTASLRWSAIFSPYFVSNGATSFGTTNTTSNIQFRQGSTSQLVGGFYGTSGNLVLQVAGSSLGTDSGQRLQVMGTTLLGGNTSIAGDFLPDTLGTRNVGSATLRFSSIYAGNFYSGGTAVFGSILTTGPVLFRQSASAQYVGGFFATTGNHFIQPVGVLPTDTGERLQVTGTSLLNGATSIGGALTPTADAVYSLGTGSFRWATVVAPTFINSTAVTFGTTNNGSSIFFRQGTTSQYVGGFYLTSGNFSVQPAGATLGTDTGERLQVEGTSRLGGAVTVTGSITPTTDNTYSVGSSSVGFQTIYSRGYFSPGTVTIGNTSSGFNLLFRQGSSTQLVGGFFATSNNFVIQGAASALPVDSGHRLQVQGTARITGKLTMTADIEFSANTQGVIYIDRGDGLKKRIVVTNNVLTFETVP